jgi:hypothetical protein
MTPRGAAKAQCRAAIRRALSDFVHRAASCRRKNARVGSGTILLVHKPGTMDDPLIERDVM